MNHTPMEPQEPPRSPARSRGAIRPAWAVVVALALLLSPVIAEASTIIAPSIDEMTLEADAVVVARVSAVETLENAVGIYRVVHLSVREVWKSPCEEDRAEQACPTVGREITVRARGGQSDGRVTRVFGAAEYSAGEDVLVFLRRRTNVADSVASDDPVDPRWESSVLAWTKFRVLGRGADARAVRAVDGLALVAPPGEPRVKSAQDDQTEFSLRALRERVAETLRVAGDPER